MRFNTNGFNGSSLTIMLLVVLFLSSCKKQDHPISVEEFENAVFIVNEGNFTAGNASLSYYNHQSNLVEQQVFYRKNNAPLGDVANSISIDNNNIFVVVNNSHTVFKLNSEDATFQAKNNQLTSPRFVLKIDNERLLVSDLYETNLSLLSISDLELISKIPIGRTSENLLQHNNKVFITNWSAYNQDKPNNMLMVLNTSSMQITDSIQIGIEANSIVKDKDNNIWVLCSGGFMNEEKPSLWKISSNDNGILKKYEFDEIDSSPTNLKINTGRDSLFFVNNCIYTMSIYDETLSTNCFISPNENVNFYSLGIGPDNNIYATDANDYSRNGDVYRYSPTGLFKHKFEAGIIPGAIGFK